MSSIESRKLKCYFCHEMLSSVDSTFIHCRNCSITFGIIWFIIERTCVWQRTRTQKIRAPLTTTLGHPKSMQCNFNSCSFNYKSDYNVFWQTLWNYVKYRYLFRVVFEANRSLWNYYLCHGMLSSVDSTCIHCCKAKKKKFVCPNPTDP